MSSIHELSQSFASSDEKIRRQVAYWMATVGLYSICVGLLWLEAWAGNVATGPAIWLTASISGGVLIFYFLIRASKHLHLRPAQLATYQGNFAIVCIVAAYAISGPIRGAALVLLLVVLVFCAFTLKPGKSRRMSLFAIVLLGMTMIWMVSSNPEQFKPRLELAHFLLAATMMLVVAYLTGELNMLRVRLQEQKEELAVALMRIQVMATRDELTSLANRRYMSDILEQEERRHNTQGLPVCIALIDIDLFKQINDTYGHAAGDEVLRKFAQRAQVALRTGDVLARWGGEEFLLLLPDTDLHAAEQILQRLQEQIASLDFSDIGNGMRVTFSCGLVALGEQEPIDEAVRRADHAMYRAKSAGRNRVVVG
jgi:diguanylate cyclase